FADATDFHGLSALIRRIRENPRFLLVAETMINAQILNCLLPRLCRPMCGSGYALPGAAGFLIGLCPSGLAPGKIIEVEPMLNGTRSRNVAA
ncbi:MAG: hypothetical protein MOB07_11485, partial [Acidobacteria bacterium]|nr:hypothetical protein [Acidobacteriota bacterium]